MQVASLFRNFLLAERVMRSYDCNPVSQPTLPATHQVRISSFENMSTYCVNDLRVNVNSTKVISCSAHY
jgi:hypothetical protein